MRGLSVRWSLADTPAESLDALRDYVADVSHGRFSGMDGLQFKAWRAQPGVWFEGTYFFATDAARDAFQATFTAGAADSPVSQLLGRAPESIEPCAVIAVAEGGSGFGAAARLD